MPALDANRATYITFPDDPTVDVSNLSIRSESLSLEEILCENSLVFGESNATKFEVDAFNLEDVTGKKIYVYQDYGNGVTVPIFTGIVDSCKKDTFGYYRSIVAYDELYSIGSANIAGWWYDFWDEIEEGDTVTLKELRESLLDFVGIPYDDTTVLFNDDFELSKPGTITNMSFSTMLKLMGEISAVFPHIDRNGTLKFISLKPTTPLVTTNITSNYQHGNSKFEGFVTSVIDKVQIFDYNNNIVGTSDSEEPLTDVNIYSISNNLLLYNLKGDDANDFAESYLAEIEDITYCPCELEMVLSDWSLKLGTYIKAEDVVTSGNDVTSIVLQNSFSGSLLIDQTITAKGEEFISETSKQFSDEYTAIMKKTEDLKADILAEALISYTYMNTNRYEITPTAALPTPVVEIHATTTAVANLIFLATINFTTQSTVTEQVSESVTITEPASMSAIITEPTNESVTITEETEGSLPVNATLTHNNPAKSVTIAPAAVTKTVTLTKTRYKPVKVKCSYWWNYGDLLYYPTEQYDVDGDHALTLCFFINNVPKDTAGTLQVKIETENGDIVIAPLAIKATMFGQGLSASASQWDGTIVIEEDINPISLTIPNISIGTISDSVTVTKPNITTQSITDQISAITINNIPTISIGNISSGVTIGTVVHTIRIITEFANQYTYNTSFVDTANNTFKLKTDYKYIGTATTVDSGLLTEVEIPLNNFDTITNLEVTV